MVYLIVKRSLSHMLLLSSGDGLLAIECQWHSFSLSLCNWRPTV